MKDFLIIIRGGGDIATGVAVRLFRVGFKIVILETENPTAVRLTVSFASAVYHSKTLVEDVEAVFINSYENATKIVKENKIPVLVDPAGKCISRLKPYVLVDAIMAKKNLGTFKDQAPIVIGLGPGFKAGIDVDAVIETKRGHNLGRVINCGSALQDTGIPGEIRGESKKRLLKSPKNGTIIPFQQIGNKVNKGDLIALIEGVTLKAEISGILRGLIYPNSKVTKGMKIGDIDPRGIKNHCFSISDKARSVGGGVLEVICANINSVY